MNTTVSSGAAPAPAMRAAPGHGEPHTVNALPSSVTIARSSVSTSTRDGCSHNRRASVVLPVPDTPGHSTPLPSGVANAHACAMRPTPRADNANEYVASSDCNATTGSRGAAPYLTVYVAPGSSQTNRRST